MNKHNDSLYSYTKSVRFRLNHVRGKLPETDTVAEADLNKLCEAGRRLAEELEKFIYRPKANNPSALARDSQVLINKKWLKQFFKDDFYEQRRRTNELCCLPYALEGIARWRKDWQNILDNIEKANEAASHDQTRRSDIASLLLQLHRRDQFAFIQEFARYARHKNRKNPLPDHTEAVEEQLQAALAKYAPAQGAGIVVAAVSLNYYTVNKKPKEYYDNKIREARKEYDQLSPKYEEMKENKAAQKSRLLEQMLAGRLNLEQIEKDQELSLFHQAQDRDCLQEMYRLTGEIGRLNAELNKHKGRHSAGMDHYQKPNGKLLKEAKQKRGSYFIRKTKGKYLRGWWNYCEAYKKTAMKLGKVKAQLLGLEKERQESQQLRYWAVFLRRKERLSLCCIPLHKCQEAKKYIEKKVNTKAGSADSEVNLYRFHSITQRALHKLCFAESSSFAADLPFDLRDMLSDANKASNDAEQIAQKNNPEQKTKAQLELEFFQALLKDSEATHSLELSRFDFSAALRAEKSDEFQMAFDEAGYDVEKIPLDSARVKTFIDRFKVLEFELTSYDLEKRNEDIHQTPASDARRHTQLWRQFWQDVEKENWDNVRLNPELKIRLREADPELSEYLRKKGFDLEQAKHRRLQDQYNLHFTMELNAGRLHRELAFAKADKINEEIDRFNETFNQQNWEKSWKYGIDRGQIELATLCLARFDKNDTYTYRGETRLRPRFPEGEEDIKVYELKRKKYNLRAISELETRPRNKRREKKVIANLSYFIDRTEDPEWFSQHSCTCIDLTTAKVISGKLVSNGDVLTFLKLKYEAAKRALFDLVAKGIITAENKQLAWGSESDREPAFVQLRYDSSNSEPVMDKDAEDRTIYYFEGTRGRNLEGVELGNGTSYTRESIREALQHYLDELWVEQAKPTGAANKHVPTIDKINHLRDALVANMIGVIMHLQKEYPGIVILEDLNMGLIQEHFQALNIDISRRLEFALYRKFQSLGKVPPHLKDLTQRRERLHERRQQEIEEERDKTYSEWKRKNKAAPGSEKQNKNKEFTKDIHTNKNFSSQIGAIVFVDEYNTSKNCPYCGETIDWVKDINKRLKFEQHRFSCGKDKSCGFDTDRFGKADNRHEAPPLAEPAEGGAPPDFDAFREIDDPDKVAAYNVAKKIQHWTKIGHFSNFEDADGKGR